MYVSRLCTLVIMLSLWAVPLWGQEALSDAVGVFDGAPAARFNRHVDVVTGTFTESEVEMYVAGVQPIVIDRVLLCEGTSYTEQQQGHWRWDLESELDTYFHGYKVTLPPTRKMAVRDHGGGMLVFYGPRHSYSGKAVPRPEAFKKARTNTSCGVLSGGTNPHNKWVYFADERHWVYEADGTVAYYDMVGYYRAPKRERDDAPYEPKHLRSYLRKKYHPNGNRTHYERESYGRLRRIWTTDATETCTFASVNFFYENSPTSCSETIRMVASDGQEVVRRYASFPMYSASSGHKSVFYSLTTVAKTASSEVSYNYWGRDYLKGMVQRSTRPDGRYTEHEYYKQKDNVLGGGLEDEYVDLKKGGRWLLQRIKLQRGPVGKTDEAIVTARFRYRAKDRHGEKYPDHQICEAFDALGHKSVYHSSFGRLVRIESFEKEALYSVESFSYATQSHQQGNLLAHRLEDATGQLVVLTEYTYDDKGNVLKETLTGDLTGSGDITSYTKERTYYNNLRFHLLASEVEGDKETRYTYKPDTNLIASKFVVDTGKICQRTFYRYNDHALLEEEICDDGSSEDLQDLTDVKERHYVRQTFRDQAPAFGYVASREEGYVDLATNTSIPLKTVRYGYDTRSRITEEGFYDAEGVLCHTIFRAFDDHSNVLFETDPLGHRKEYAYDANDNKIQEFDSHSGITTSYTYDFSNRLTAKCEAFPEGVSETTRYDYDYLGNKTSEISPQGEVTEYVYDDLSRLVETRHPPVMNAEGLLERPVTRQEYDVLGRVTTQIDPEGRVTKRRYTARGDLAEVLLPSGYKESHRYHPNGHLAKSFVGDEGCGAEKTYVRDALGRVTKIYESCAGNEERLGELTFGTPPTVEEKRYEGLRCVEEVDSNGFVTQMSYDGAGRLIAMRQEGLVVEQGYDARGRICQLRLHTSPSTWTTTVKTYDALDRVTSEAIYHQDGTLQRRAEQEYDALGNITASTTYVNNEAATSYSFYDSKSRLIEKIDVEGHRTRQSFDDFFPYEGQMLRRCESTDPLGNTTETLTDLLGRTVRVSKKNAFGQLLAQKRSWYDLSGLKCREQELALPSATLSERTYRYDARGLLIEEVEAPKAEERRVTRYTYRYLFQSPDAFEECVVIKPDGRPVTYLYDYKGRESRVYGEGVDIRTKYDGEGHIVALQEGDALWEGVRNAQGLLIAERYHIGTTSYTLTTEYDGAGRKVLQCLPDASITHYTYQGLYPAAIARKDYSVSYQGYDLGGKPHAVQLPWGLLPATFSWDAKGRLQDLQSPYVEEHVTYDAIGNVLSQRNRKKTSTYSYDDLYQIASETGHASHRYVYNAVQERIFYDEKEQKHNAVHELLFDGRYRYTYDPNGNTLSDGKNTYEYDLLNRLITSTNSCGQKTRYQYCGLSRRVAKHGATTEYCLYDDAVEVGRLDSQGNLTALRLIGRGRHGAVGAMIAVEIEGKPYAVLQDHRGSVAGLIAPGGKTFTYSYTAFGQPVGAPKLNNPWQFAGEATDRETGLVFFGFRYYHPLMGRWVSLDPAGPVDGCNLYAYVQNNPLTYKDLYGLACDKPERSEENKSLGRMVRDGLRAMGRACRSAGRSFRETSAHPFGHRHENGGVHIIQRKDGIKETYEVTHENYEACFKGMGDTTLFENGMLTSKEAALKAAHETAEATYNKGEDYSVIVLHNKSHGFIRDTAECVSNFWGYRSPPVKDLREVLLSWNAVADSSAHLAIIAHSQGALITRAALRGKQIKAFATERIEVAAFGPGCVLSKGTALGINNYMSLRDPIPMINFFHFAKGKLSGNLKILKPAEGAGIIDHCFRGPTYANAAIEALTDFNTRRSKTE